MIEVDKRFFLRGMECEQKCEESRNTSLEGVDKWGATGVRWRKLSAAILWLLTVDRTLSR